MASLRERGWTGTIAAVLAKSKDFFFDLKYGTDTRGWAHLEGMDFSSSNKARATHYQPTSVAMSQYAFNVIRPGIESVFIDLGCGKGRVLFLAYFRGFKRVVGVEFSPQLCRIAKKNIEILEQKLGRKVDIEIRELDVTDYPWRDDETVIFLFNPFDSVVLNKVLDAIQSSLERRPRQAWIIYVNPLHRALLEAAGCFKLMCETEVWGDHLAIFVFEGKVRLPRCNS